MPALKPFLASAVIFLGVTGLALGAAGPALGSAPAAHLQRGGLTHRSLASACAKSFNPYAVRKSLLAACGDGVFPVQRVQQLTGGGKEYSYDVDGIKTLSRIPPPGFDPLGASAGKLAEYGLPPRPAGGQALRSWRTLMRKTHLVAPPQYLVGKETTRQPTGITPNVTVNDNPIWAGNAADVHTYKDVYGYWLEPHIYSSACSPTAESVWAGLGGQNTGTLAQAGTAVGEPGLSAHQAWYELISGSTNIFKTNIPVTATPGGEFVAEVDHQSGGYYIYLANEYTGVAEDYSPSFAHYDGSTAELIAEDPEGGWTNGGPYLSNFKTFEVEDAEASENATTYHGLGYFDHVDDVMKVNGRTMASAGSTFNSGDSWNDTQSWCG